MELEVRLGRRLDSNPVVSAEGPTDDNDAHNPGPANQASVPIAVEDCQLSAGLALLRRSRSGGAKVPVVDVGAEHEVRLSGRDLMMLRAGLRAYVDAFSAHRAEDGGVSHPESQWRDLQREVGQLLWRLEEASAAPGSRVEHSEDAVEPDGA